MLRAMPSVQTTLTPAEIIGVEFRHKFLAHYRICCAESNSGEFPHSWLKKEFTAEERHRVGEILADLRDNGFYPVGLTEHGQIRWFTSLQPVVTTLLFDNLRENPITDMEEEKRLARGGYREIAYQENL